MKMKLFYACLVSLIWMACSNSGAPLPSVKEFDIKQFEGFWFEIAHLPNICETNKECITADYTLKEDGSYEMVASGIDIVTGKETKIKGKAWRSDVSKKAVFNIQFENTLSATYSIIALDSNYQYAVLAHASRKYFSILCRSPQMNAAALTSVLQVVTKAGFNTKKLTYTKQDCLK